MRFLEVLLLYSTFPTTKHKGPFLPKANMHIFLDFHDQTIQSEGDSANPPQYSAVTPPESVQTNTETPSQEESAEIEKGSLSLDRPTFPPSYTPIYDSMMRAAGKEPGSEEKILEMASLRPRVGCQVTSPQTFMSAVAELRNDGDRAGTLARYENSSGEIGHPYYSEGGKDSEVSGNKYEGWGDEHIFEGRGR
jgi:hypothetical protein